MVWVNYSIIYEGCHNSQVDQEKNSNSNYSHGIDKFAIMIKNKNLPL